MLNFTSNTPSDVANIYSQAFAKGMADGLDTDESERAAMRSIAHAGWYQTKQGWQRLGADVRDKVNLRKAEKQPDGKYIVRGVDVFYPNAVKADEHGNPVQYTADNIRARIANTNAAIANGGQAPPLSKGHPHLLQKANGIQLPAVGRAINWTESPRSPGMARCDLVDIPAHVIENEWANGHWTGLSAGLVSDANRNNERFGHVALLGVDSQALSHLPTTEVFSVDQCLFSADCFYKQSKGKTDMDKALLIQLAKANANFSTACAALFSDEEGAEAQVADAFSGLTETMESFNSSCDDKDGAEKDGNYQGQEAQELIDLPAKPKLPIDGGTGPATDLGKGNSFSAKDDNQFAALANEVTALRETVAKQNGLISNFQTVVGGMAAKVARQEFSTFVNGLIAEGHNFDQAEAMNMFAANVGNKAGMESLKTFLKKSPKTSLASNTTVFGADANSPDGSAQTFSTEMSKEVTDLINFAAPGMALTEEDMALARAMQGGR